jgi:pantoate--beta-alanine ligase
VPCPIVREKGGLALSSRNSYLSANEKKISLNIFKILKLAKQDFKKCELSLVKRKALNRFKKIPNSKVDYAEIVKFDDLSKVDKKTKRVVFAVAVWIGKTRLIDNIIMSKK